MADTERSEAGTIEAAAIPITLDVDTLTLGEMATIEMQSGLPFSVILAAAIKGGATRRLLALWVQESRNSAQPRSWRELANLRPSVKRS